MAIPKGFTLVECLVALSILCALTAAATQSWKIFYLRQQEQKTESRLISGLQTTRQYALFKQQTMTFCPAKDLQNCDGNWRGSWIIKDASNNVLLAFQHAHPISASYRGYPNSKEIRFEHTGLALSNGHFQVGARCIVVNAGGRIRTALCHTQTS